jgi:O-antigen/teichoic acid export membrane protein
VRDSSPANGASRASFRKTLATIFVMAALAAVATYLVGAGLIRAFAPIYSDSLGALLALCVMMPFGAINSVGMYALGGEGRFKTLVAVAVVNLVSTAGLMLWLVPEYGATGAATALLGCQLLSGALLLGLGLRRAAHRPS